jgi:apolipoprotein N-acyltransferase
VYFGTGLFPCWPLLWFAPLPVLLFAQRSSWWAAGLCAFFGWSLGALNNQHYFGSLLHLPRSVQAEIIAGPAVLLAISVLLFRALVRRGASWSALLAFPAVYTSCEFLVDLGSPHGTAGSLSYSQLNFLPFLQLASITGPWGMTFFILLFSSGVAVAIYLWKSAFNRAILILAASWGSLALVLIFGAVRLAISPQGPAVKVGLIASDLRENQNVATEGPNTQRLLRAYADEAEALAAQGAQVIVIPEKIGVIVESSKASADALLQSVADKANVVIVAGIVEVDPPASYNRARVYTPGTPVQTYDKHHMLPPFELRFKPGTSLTTLQKPSGTWGVEICKDMDFTPLSRKYGQSGAGLMLVPAWDFVLDRVQHGHMAVMRGVEDGFSIARAARQGFLTVSEDRGRILAETRSDSAPFATLLAAVPAVHDRTIYLLFGDWFAWMSIAVAALTCVQLYRVRGRGAPKEVFPPTVVAHVSR